jgi:uncharacterized tellurite resistance protein B-like protein
MLKKIQSLVSGILGESDSVELAGDEVKLACAALLVHCARADGEKSAAEVASMRKILSERYQLTSEETDSLIELAAEREAQGSDIHKFTRVLHENLDREGRLEVVRLLWEICNADNHIDHDEKSVTNLVASLLHVETADAVALRRSVQKGGR